MKTLVSGSTGMVGTAVIESLLRDGHTVCPLLRPESKVRSQAAGFLGAWGPAVRWDPVGNTFDPLPAQGADAVVHLAGASIGEGRWTEARKRLLRTSRVDATRHLVRVLAQFAQLPKVFVSASAMGYYGDRGEEELTEESAAGDDFLAALARDWEAEAARAAEFGARVVMLRFGIILAPHGGALARMLPPFRLGLGGRLGSGRQWMSWLTLEEVVGIIRSALENANLHGPVNAVSPNPVRNREFTAVLGRVLHRPAIFPAPAFALRLALGEMAGPLLLGSQRLVPGKLRVLGYKFLQPDLEPALSALLRHPV
ncbi:MAG: TIGR01777 family protein [Acidobacteria bacterium]|nr:TIGR01777 family protein [Acidobacteriota bacterium]